MCSVPELTVICLSDIHPKHRSNGVALGDLIQIKTHSVLFQGSPLETTIAKHSHGCDILGIGSYDCVVWDEFSAHICVKSGRIGDNRDERIR